MECLSPRQRDVLDFITAQVMQRGVPPTYREIGDALCIASTNGVADHVKALVRKGYLKKLAGRPGGVARGIQLTSKARSVRRSETVVVEVTDEDGKLLGAHTAHRSALPANHECFAVVLPRRTIVSDSGDVLLCTSLDAAGPRPGMVVLVREGNQLDVVQWHTPHVEMYQAVGQVFAVHRQVTPTSTSLDLRAYQHDDDELERQATARRVEAPAGIRLQDLLRAGAHRYVSQASLVRNAHMHSYRGPEPEVNDLSKVVGAVIRLVKDELAGSATDLADAVVAAAKTFAAGGARELERVIACDYANWAAREHGGVDLGLYERDLAA